MGLAEGPQPTLDQRRIGQNPAVQGGVVDLQAALDEQLLDVTIAERIAQVPGDGLQDQRRLEVAALEIVLRPALQLLDKGVQEHRPPPVRRRICRPHAQRGVNAKTLRQPPRKRTSRLSIWRMSAQSRLGSCLHFRAAPQPRLLKRSRDAIMAACAPKRSDSYAV